MLNPGAQKTVRQSLWTDLTNYSLSYRQNFNSLLRLNKSSLVKKNSKGVKRQGPQKDKIKEFSLS